MSDSSVVDVVKMSMSDFKSVSAQVSVMFAPTGCLSHNLGCKSSRKAQTPKTSSRTCCMPKVGELPTNNPIIHDNYHSESSNKKNTIVKFQISGPLVAPQVSPSRFMCIYIYIYTYIHTYIYIYIYTYT